MGLLVSVYRQVDSQDCTAGGVSGQVANLTIVNVPGPFEPTPGAPAAWLVEGNLSGLVKIVVKDPAKKHSGYCQFGGNYAFGDSNFGQAVAKMTGQRFGFPVQIHDRYEH